MYLVRKFTNIHLNNYLKNSLKESIFPIGNDVGQHLTSYYDLYNEDKNLCKVFKPLIDFNIDIYQKYNVNIDKKYIFIENRDIILNNETFEGKLHIDSFNDDGNSCWTSVYYYHLDKTLNGGELLFPPFGKYKPKEGNILFFDGDIKHKINKMYGIGKRGTVICSFRKSFITKY
jgi:hypothetical protein